MIIRKTLLKKTTIVFLSLITFIGNTQNAFIQNKGQFPNQVVSKVNIPSGSLYIEKDGLFYSFYSSNDLRATHDSPEEQHLINAHSYRVNFLNSNFNVENELYYQSNYYENYYIGNDSLWAEYVRSYKFLEQRNIYNGVDIKYYVYNNRLKYDFIVSPNSSTKQINLHYDGVDEIELYKENIYIKTSVNSVLEYAPFAYQIINGDTIEIVCKYLLKNQTVSFDFPEGYNKEYKLIIDPILDFSTYSGSTTDNFGYTATYDKLGFLYSGSTAFGTGYPTSIGAFQISYSNLTGGTDIAITKYDTSGTNRIYSTYLGGTLDEMPHSMIVNSDNELFIFGTTGSSDFPTTTNAFQKAFAGGNSINPPIGVSFPNGTDIFVSRLDVNGGVLLASTYIGGEGNDGLNTSSKLRFNYADEVRGEIDIDKNNNIYIATCTESSDFPSKNSFSNDLSGQQDGCIIKLDNSLSAIIWSAYLGGRSDDAIYSLALDELNNIYVTGGTLSSNFPSTINSYQASHQNTLDADAFVAKISSNGNQLLSSSYFGTEHYDQSYFVEIGSNNNVYLFGQTKSEGMNLVYNSSYFEPDGGQFVAVFNSNLSQRLRSTVFGSGKGTPDISPTAFLVDLCDKIYIAGWGSSLGGALSTLNLPVSSTAFQTNTDGNDMYLMVLDDLMNNIIYATYFGGTQSSEHVDGGTSRFDKRGIIYQSVCAGCGGYSDFPVEPNPGAVSLTNNSTNCNNAVFKFDFDFPIVISDFNSPEITCDNIIRFENLTDVNATTTFLWQFGDGNTSTDRNPTHEYLSGGFYNVTLISSDVGSCNISDTITKQIYILSNSSDSLPDLTKCPLENLQIGILPIANPIISYQWSPTLDLSITNISNPYTSTSNDQNYQMLISDGTCTDTIYQSIRVTNLGLKTGNDTIFCNDTIKLNATYSNLVNSVQWSSSYDFLDTLSTVSELLVFNSKKLYIKVTNGYCVETDSIEVKTDSIELSLVSNDICDGDLVTLEAINLNPFVELDSYIWQGFALNTNIIQDYPDTSQWYFLEVVNENGCKARDSILVNVYPKPKIDSVWVPFENPYQGQNTYIYMYTDGVIDSIPVLINESGWYQVIKENEFGCTDTDSIWLSVSDINCTFSNFVIPNAFTPYSSYGKNDHFNIKEIEQGLVDDFNIKIFNRFGQEVFNSDNIEISWDGKFNNQKMNPQVFDFFLYIKCINGKELFYKGNITLVR